MAFTSGWLCDHELRNTCATCPCPLEQNSGDATGSANAEEPCEHTVSWNRVKCCTNVRRISLKRSAAGEWPSRSFNVIQDHCRCCHLIGHIRFPIKSSIVSISVSCTVFEILPLICQNNKTSRDPRPSGGQFVITRQALLRPTRAQNLTTLCLAVPDKFKGGVKF